MRPKKNLKLKRFLEKKICPFCRHKVLDHYSDHMVLCGLTRHPKFSSFPFPEIGLAKETLGSANK